MTRARREMRVGRSTVASDAGDYICGACLQQARCAPSLRSQQLIRGRRRRQGFSARSRRSLLARCLPARVVDADCAVNACDPVFVLAGRVSGRVFRLRRGAPCSSQPSERSPSPKHGHRFWIRKVWENVCNESLSNLPLALLGVHCLWAPCN